MAQALLTLRSVQSVIFAALVAAGVLTAAAPAFAASALEGFGAEFREQASDTAHFSKGRQVEFFRDSDARGYGAEVKGLVTTSETASANTTHDFNKRDNLTTVMVSGTYDLPKRLNRNMPLHPFVTGGVGLAMYDAGQLPDDAAHGVGLVPVLKVGGGLAYKVNEKVALTASYKTGFTPGAGDEHVNLQLAELGMKLQF